MSKANQAFKQNDEAVSPVIGVILMVAITVVLAAVVFVLVSNLGSQQEQSENASATATSPSSDVIEITLVREGDTAPYDNTDSGSDNDFSITLNGEQCDMTPDGLGAYETGVSGPAQTSLSATDGWKAGIVIRISGQETAAQGTDTVQTANACADSFNAGYDDVSISVTVAGTTILSTTVDVRA